MIDSLSISPIETPSTSDLFKLAKGFLQDQRYEEALQCYDDFVTETQIVLRSNLGEVHLLGFTFRNTQHTCDVVHRSS